MHGNCCLTVVCNRFDRGHGIDCRAKSYIACYVENSDGRVTVATKNSCYCGK